MLSGTTVCSMRLTSSIQFIFASDLVNDPVAVGIRQTLLFKGVHLLLGNDLAGDKVVINPFVTDKPCMDQY